MKCNLILNEYIKDLNINCFYYKYSNGLTLIYVEDNDCKEKIDINITLLTPAIDNTGVTHIIEHCIASEIYNKKFLKQNASTIQDRTSYEYIIHREDIDEVKSILNEIFFPKFRNDKNIFLREGWRVDFENNNSFIRGVVFNEVLEAFTSPIYSIVNYIPATLFRNSIYENIAGGIPECILDLTLNNIIDYHSDYYKSNNCCIYVHGADCLDEFMKVSEPVIRKLSYNGEKKNHN